MTWVDDLWAGFSDSDKEKIMLNTLENFFEADREFTSKRLASFVDEDKFREDPKVQELFGQLVVLFQEEADENPEFSETNVIELKDFQGK